MAPSAPCLATSLSRVDPGCFELICSEHAVFHHNEFFNNGLLRKIKHHFGGRIIEYHESTIRKNENWQKQSDILEKNMPPLKKVLFP
jgi:hypothetical protein